MNTPNFMAWMMLLAASAAACRSQNSSRTAEHIVPLAEAYRMADPSIKELNKRRCDPATHQAPTQGESKTIYTAVKADELTDVITFYSNQDRSGVCRDADKISVTTVKSFQPFQIQQLTYTYGEDGSSTKAQDITMADPSPHYGWTDAVPVALFWRSVLGLETCGEIFANAYRMPRNSYCQRLFAAPPRREWPQGDAASSAEAP